MAIANTARTYLRDACCLSWTSVESQDIEDDEIGYQFEICRAEVVLGGELTCRSSAEIEVFVRSLAAACHHHIAVKSCHVLASS